MCAPAISAYEDDLAIRTSKVKHVKVSSFIEFREFIQDDTPCVLCTNHSFQDILMNLG